MAATLHSSSMRQRRGILAGVVELHERDPRHALETERGKRGMRDRRVLVDLDTDADLPWISMIEFDGRHLAHAKSAIPDVGVGVQARHISARNQVVRHAHGAVHVEKKHRDADSSQQPDSEQTGPERMGFVFHQQVPFFTTYCQSFPKNRSWKCWKCPLERLKRGTAWRVFQRDRR